MSAEKLDRIVLDTNVIVSFIINQDADQLADWVAEYGITFYVCPELLNELKTTFAKPTIKKFLNEPIPFYIDFIESLCEVVSISKRFDRASDPDDNFLFDLAYTVKAYYLVTGERSLLNMKQVNRIQIISLAEFKRLVRNAV
jgi:putative PIN family toxin of toxin-antitoxin system